MTGPRLVADITGHGFGHLAQTGVVLNTLRKLRPDIALTLRCAHPRDVLARFVEGDFNVAPPPPDPGMAMFGPSWIDVEGSLKAYHSMFDDWEGLLTREADTLAALAPDLLYTNVGFVGVAAAGRLGVRSVGLCSLNWLDIFSAYCADSPGGAVLMDQIAAAYDGLELFMRPEPSMPMSLTAPQRDIGPISRVCGTKRDEASAKLKRRLGRAHIVLASLGGIPSDADWDQMLPRDDDVFWIIPKDAPAGRADIADCETLGMHVFEAFCASDLVVTKSGYGTFAEAACNGVRVLYAARPDWPEAPALEGWIEQYACAAACTQDALYRGDYLETAKALLRRPAVSPRSPTGGDEAAQILNGYL